MAFPPTSASTFARMSGSLRLVVILFQSVLMGMSGLSMVSVQTPVGPVSSRAS